MSATVPAHLMAQFIPFDCVRLQHTMTCLGEVKITSPGGLHHVTKDMISLIPWHLDTNLECGIREKARSEDSQHIRQPWRALWPPCTDEAFRIWLSCEHPEVLFWQFDPAKPFDRPWRTWARTTRAEAEQSALNQLTHGNSSEEVGISRRSPVRFTAKIR